MSRPWIQTHLGKKIDLLEPDLEQIDIRDIAFHLSHINRYTGAAGDYNVADHSVRVARAASRGWLDIDAAKAGLLHDATEAYLGDMSSPLKRLLPEYQALERRWMEIIGRRFDVCLTPLPDAVKRADIAMCATEARDLMVFPPEPWGLTELSLPEKVVPWRPSKAESVFLGWYSLLWKVVPPDPSPKWS